MSKKSFRVWKSDGEPETIEATRAEFTRKSNGLEVTLFTGMGKKVKHSSVVAFTEIQPPIIIEKK